MSIVPPQDQGVTTPPTNELTVLAEFIQCHAAAPFDRHLSAILSETGTTHDSWATNCQVNHFHDDIPCEEYERGISLGIAWLKARIEGGAGNVS